MRKSIPNIITLLALSCGIAGIFFAFALNFKVVLLLIVLAGIFDFADGFAARLLNARSELGVQLDSLSDMVSFGVLPSVTAVIYMANLLDLNGIHEVLNESVLNILLVCLPVLIALMSALRLGRFNIDDSQQTSFKGLPTPANALFIASFILFFGTGQIDFLNHIAIIYMSAGVFLFCAIMLVAKVRLFSLKIKSLNLSENWYRYSLIPVIIVGYWFAGLSTMIVVIPYYIVLSLILQSKLEEIDAN